MKIIKFVYIYMKSSFPKRYKSILIVFMKINFFLPKPIHFVNIQFIMLEWSVGSSEQLNMIVKPPRPHHHTERSRPGFPAREAALYKERQRLQLLASVARAPLCEVREWGTF